MNKILCKTHTTDEGAFITVCWLEWRKTWWKIIIINVTSYQASHDHYLKVDHTHLLEIIKLSWKRSTQSCKLFHCPPPRHSQWQSTPPPVVALIWNFSTFLVRYMISHSFGFCYCLLDHSIFVLWLLVMFALNTNLNSPNRIVKRVHVWNFEATDTVVKVWVLSDIFNVLIIMLVWWLSCKTILWGFRPLRQHLHMTERQKLSISCLEGRDWKTEK